jgi:DNA-binding NarL/FixJ family response regulator
LIRQIDAAPPPHGDGALLPPGLDLTPRELEVLRLVAVGKSNQEIARDLVLSVRTVERHVSNIYIKLGATGPAARATTAAYALRHGVVPS